MCVPICCISGVATKAGKGHWILVLGSELGPSFRVDIVLNH